MRYQFFLDARDYLKFALLEDLMKAPSLRQLTLVWLLTPDVENGHGRRRPNFSPDRPLLNGFFGRYPTPTLPEVPKYFEGQGTSCNSYGDDPSNYLTSRNRDMYFAQIPGENLEGALVFLDPDNGVEPRSGASTAHVRLQELTSLWTRLDVWSGLVVYQHKPRVGGTLFWPGVARRVETAIRSKVSILAYGDVGFIIADRAGDPERLSKWITPPPSRTAQWY